VKGTRQAQGESKHKEQRGELHGLKDEETVAKNRRIGQAFGKRSNGRYVFSGRSAAFKPQQATIDTRCSRNGQKRGEVNFVKRRKDPRCLNELEQSSPLAAIRTLLRLKSRAPAVKRVQWVTIDFWKTMKLLSGIGLALALTLGAGILGCASHSNATKDKSVRERWNFHFDSRNWQVVFQAGNDQQAIRQYVLQGQSVTNWTELVTSLYVAGEFPPRALFEQFRRELSRGCPNVKMNIIEASENTIVFEWRHEGCQGIPPQHEIRRISAVKSGTLTLSFVEKTPELAKEKRLTWIANVTEAKPAVR
jgi:hypothetical protein